MPLPEPLFGIARYRSEYRSEEAIRANDPSSVAAGVRRNTFDKTKPTTTPKTLLKPQIPAVNCNGLLG